MVQLNGQNVAVWRTDSERYPRVFRGPLKRWFVDHDIPALYSPRYRGWTLRTERVADAIAHLEAEGFHVHVYERQAKL